jgi:hypothetical protein
VRPWGKSGCLDSDPQLLSQGAINGAINAINGAISAINAINGAVTGCNKLVGCDIFRVH